VGSGRLAEQAPGVDVVIDAVDGVVDATLLRLFEMGLVPGTVVRVTRRAPLGGPLEVAVRGTRLVLRRADARAFVVGAVAAGDGAVARGARGRR
jgi:Fe2+ transport system protein FeoA